jgi:hypothetical protein
LLSFGRLPESLVTPEWSCRGLFFNAVPDWFSFENQGGNVAAVDLDNNGHLELLVCSVDHPTPGPNRGLNRVGAKLDAEGVVSA